MEQNIDISQLTLLQLKALIGTNDENIKLLESLLKLQIDVKANFLVIKSFNNENYTYIFANLLNFVTENNYIGKNDIIQIVRLGTDYTILKNNIIAKTFKGKSIYPKSLNQLNYINAVKKSDMTFAVGPAGSGKTFLAVVLAVLAYKSNRINKIILTRPAVEAGENLGFLPGDLKEKIDPYLRPLYDCLYDMLSKEVVEKLIEKGNIEIAPLAYMRGRTLDDAFIILDEAQNTTIMQMKMFLTRLGVNSKMVITGDISQVDLKFKGDSGLIHATKVLKSISEISFNYLNSYDIVRHPLVSKIVDQYDSN